ncbi:MAG: hypothetical protein OWT28_05740 [Firmicutes bacterium]|nr:hypothetical protein [Bacillota bacterium]
MSVELHVIGKFAQHDEAAQAAHELETRFAGKVSLSTSTPHEEWWRHQWLQSALSAVGGAAAAVSQLVPGFGVLFMGGPLDGIRQGSVVADWLEAHPEEGGSDTHFVILSVAHSEVKEARQLLTELGATHVHEVLESGREA